MRYPKPPDECFVQLLAKFIYMYYFYIKIEANMWKLISIIIISTIISTFVYGCDKNNYIDAGNGDFLICSKYEPGSKEAIIFLKSVGVFDDDNIPVTVKLETNSENQEFYFIINPDNINDEIVDKFANSVLDNLLIFNSFNLRVNIVNVCDKNFRILKSYKR